MSDEVVKKKRGRPKRAQNINTWWDEKAKGGLKFFLEKFRLHFGISRPDMYRLLGWSKERYHMNLNSDAEFPIRKYPALLDVCGISTAHGFLFLKIYFDSYIRQNLDRLLINSREGFEDEDDLEDVDTGSEE